MILRLRSPPQNLRAIAAHRCFGMPVMLRAVPLHWCRREGTELELRGFLHAMRPIKPRLELFVGTCKVDIHTCVSCGWFRRALRVTVGASASCARLCACGVGGNRCTAVRACRSSSAAPFLFNDIVLGRAPWL